jgi:hypothetical protein
MTDPRPLPLWQPLAFGAVAGMLGAAWILHDYTRKAYAIGYHVPLAILFCAALYDALEEARQTGRRGFLYAAGLGGALIVGRMIEDWPVSGHGILGMLMAVTPLRPIFRIGGAAIAIQALVTKAALGEPWMAALWGAAVGAALGLFGRYFDAKIRPSRN